MPVTAPGRALLIFLSYVAAAAMFAWPLPLHLRTALPGSTAGDTAVYVWNLWVFHHELIVRHAWPFATSTLAAGYGAPVPLVLNNYTAVSNAVGLLFLPWLGIVATYNVLLLLSQALSASGMYLLANRCSRDRAAAWIAGLIFGFAPFVIARSLGHFSLVQAAPLPIFAWLLIRIHDGGSWRLATAAAATVAWAYFSDPYYAVYCLMMMVCMAAYVSVALHRREGHTSRSATLPLDIAAALLGAAIIAIVTSGGSSLDVAGLRISMRSLYTPALILTFLVLVRVVVTVRPRFEVRIPAVLRDWRMWTAFAVTGLVLVAPIASGLLSQGDAIMGPRVLWRSSSPGVDALAYFSPNPFHPLAPDAAREWVAALPQGLVENVASIPWTAIAVILAGAVVYRARVSKGWLLFTLWFGALSLGPFVHAGGYNLYVPGPWALLRYAPVIGAARAPTRMAILVLMGVAVLMAIVLAALRTRSRHPRALAAGVAAIAILELLPAPRATYAATTPAFLSTIRDDARPLAVLPLPFGLRDGLTSHGVFLPQAMFDQTVHGKPIFGAYISRLPGDIFERGEFGRSRVLQTLMTLSAGGVPTPGDRDALMREGRAFVERAGIGWVIVDRRATHQALERAAVAAFGLRETAREGALVLYEPDSNAQMSAPR